jgi:hypothetical protein
MPESPRRTDVKRADQAARAERLARALRDNLRRRKEQARSRTETDPREPLTRPSDGGEPPT